MHPGSPLDMLPQSPSEMVINPGEQGPPRFAPGASTRFGGDVIFQQHLREFEREISRRSLAVEVTFIIVESFL